MPIGIAGITIQGWGGVVENSSRWQVVQPSAYAHEQEALELLFRFLPDALPFRAWSNFEFIAEDGGINEVDAPRQFAAMHGMKLVGNLDPLSLATPIEGPRFIALDGRSWRVESIDAARARVQVVPAQTRGKSRWLGTARGESRALSQTIRDVLEEEEHSDFGCTLSGRASKKLEDLREQMQDTLRTTPIAIEGGSHVWWTYGGLTSNLLLAGHIAAAGGAIGAVASWNLKFRISEAALEQAGGWRGLQDQVPEWKPPVQPKFADLLPDKLVHEMTLRRAQKTAEV